MRNIATGSATARSSVAECAAILYATLPATSGRDVPPLILCLRLALGAVALAMAGGLHAAGLFQPAGTAEVVPATKSTSVRRSAPEAWERHVVIDRHELTAARTDVESAGAGRLLLNVRNGVQLDVVVERTAPTRWGYSLSGRVVGERVGFVTLVVHGGAVAGSIWTPDSAYELSHLGDGIHALRDVTNAPPFECGGVLPSEMAADTTAHQGGTDDGSVVDVLVVWTPEAHEYHIGGGEPQVLLQIDMMVAYANDALERSGAFVTFNLVGAEKVDYVEAPFIDLRRLADPNDGHMDHVHDLRDVLGADLVYLLSGSTAGNLGAFSAGPDSGYVLAHEFGHAFGIRHERIEPRYGGRLGPYRHGFTTENCEFTIMSYGLACRHRFRFPRPPLYASPWRYSRRDGSPLGITRYSKKRGTSGPADAVLTLNRNRHRIANLRQSHSGDSGGE